MTQSHLLPFRARLPRKNTHFPCLLIKFPSDSLPRFAFILNTREKLAEQLPSVEFSFLSFLLCDQVVKTWMTMRQIELAKLWKSSGLHWKSWIRLDFSTPLDSTALKMKLYSMTAWSLNFTSARGFSGERHSRKVSSCELPLQEIGFHRQFCVGLSRNQIKAHKIWLLLTQN